jgi:hypothetical protein
MSISGKAERALISHDEAGLLAATHHPALHDISDKALRAARVTLREQRAKERTLVRGLQRSIRGKAEERGRSFPGEVNKPARRKQVFAQALRRVNGELARREALAARAAMTENLQQALAAKRAAPRHHPSSAPSAAKGMQPKASKRGKAGVAPSKIGSVSKANKTAQAIKDARH